MEGGRVAKKRTNQCSVLKIKAYIVEERKIPTKLLDFSYNDSEHRGAYIKD